MPIITLIAAPLLFQAVASSVCPVNQYLTPDVNICYEITPSLQKPNGVDIQFLDLTNLQYLQTRWLNSSTMLSKLETETTILCWYDDQTTSTFPCP